MVDLKIIETINNVFKLYFNNFKKFYIYQLIFHFLSFPLLLIKSEDTFSLIISLIFSTIYFILGSLWLIGYIYLVKDPNKNIKDVLKSAINKLFGVILIEIIISLIHLVMIFAPLYLFLSFLFREDFFIIFQLYVFVFIFILLTIFAILIISRLIFSIPIYVNENKKLFESILESWKRTNWIFAGKYILLIFLLMFLVLILILWPFILIYLIITLGFAFSFEIEIFFVISIILYVSLYPIFVIPIILLLPLVYFKYLERSE